MKWTDEDIAISARFSGQMLIGMHMLDERDETAMDELVRESRRRALRRVPAQDKRPISTDRFDYVKAKLWPVIRNCSGRTTLWAYADDVQWLIGEVERLRARYESQQGPSLSENQK